MKSINKLCYFILISKGKPNKDKEGIMSILSPSLPYLKCKTYKKECHTLCVFFGVKFLCSMRFNFNTNKNRREKEYSAKSAESIFVYVEFELIQIDLLSSTAFLFLSNTLLYPLFRRLSRIPSSLRQSAFRLRAAQLSL